MKSHFYVFIFNYKMTTHITNERWYRSYSDPTVLHQLPPDVFLCEGYGPRFANVRDQVLLRTESTEDYETSIRIRDFVYSSSLADVQLMVQHIQHRIEQVTQPHRDSRTAQQALHEYDWYYLGTQKSRECVEYLLQAKMIKLDILLPLRLTANQQLFATADEQQEQQVEWFLQYLFTNKYQLKLVQLLMLYKANKCIELDVLCRFAIRYPTFVDATQAELHEMAQSIQHPTARIQLVTYGVMMKWLHTRVSLKGHDKYKFVMHQEYRLRHAATEIEMILHPSLMARNQVLHSLHSKHNFAFMRVCTRTRRWWRVHLLDTLAWMRRQSPPIKNEAVEYLSNRMQILYEFMCSMFTLHTNLNTDVLRHALFVLL